MPPVVEQSVRKSIARPSHCLQAQGHPPPAFDGQAPCACAWNSAEECACMRAKAQVVITEQRRLGLGRNIESELLAPKESWQRSPAQQVLTRFERECRFATSTIRPGVEMGVTAVSGVAAAPPSRLPQTNRPLLLLVRRGVSAARGTWTAQVLLSSPSSKPPGPSSSVLFRSTRVRRGAIGMMPPLCVPALRKYPWSHTYQLPQVIPVILVYATVAAIKRQERRSQDRSNIAVGSFPPQRANKDEHVFPLWHLANHISCSRTLSYNVCILRSSFASGTRPTRDRVGCAPKEHSIHFAFASHASSACPLFGSQACRCCAHLNPFPRSTVPPLRPTDPGAIARARPVLETLMRKRAASAYACIANPQPPPAPGATNHHRAFPVYPATDRYVDDYVREIGRIEGRLVSKPSYNTRALAPWYTAPVDDGHTGSPARACLFGLARALAPVAGVYRDREMASDTRSCLLLSSKWDKNPSSRHLMSTSTSHDNEWTGFADKLIGSSSPEPANLPACTSVLSNT
ncbi:hypothetical protein V8C34DRAFT_318404 [Trichoderma compactum]